MARVKRRRSSGLRGLGAAAAVHKKHTLVWSDIAVGDYDLAEHWAKQGKCNDAFDYYGNARHYAGRSAEASDHASMSTGWANKELVLLKSATDAIKKHCLVGGGLSGARRRRRK